MTAIYLYGDLQNFGERFELDVQTPAEAIRALCYRLKGFRLRIREGAYRVYRKKANGKEIDLTHALLGIKIPAGQSLHIVPVVAGSGGRTGKIVLGVALVAAAVIMAPPVVGAMGPTLGMSTPAFSILGMNVTFAQIAGFGASMILGGICSLFSKNPSSDVSSSSADTNASSLFDGPQNVSQQGVPVPLVYGRFECGAVLVSSDLTAEDVISE